MDREKALFEGLTALRLEVDETIVNDLWDRANKAIAQSYNHGGADARENARRDIAALISLRV